MKEIISKLRNGMPDFFILPEDKTLEKIIEFLYKEWLYEQFLKNKR